MFYGILLVFAISIGSIYLNDVFSVYIQLEALTIGMVLGMIWGNSVGVGDSLLPGIRFSLKKLLKVGIVLLGLKLSAKSLMVLNPLLLAGVVVFVPTVIFAGTLIGKRCGLDKKLSVLIGVGSSICGASAIVAMSPVIDAEEEDSIIAVGVISVLGALGVILYSVVANLSSLSDVDYGLWSGLSLQGVAHALAAAFARGDEAGQFGTIIKMERVLLLAPVSIVLGLLFSGKKSSGSRKSASIPVYILLFILAGVLSTFGVVPESVKVVASKLSSFFILMSIVAMGLLADMQSLRKKGAKGLVAGTVVFIIVSVCAFGMVHFLG